MDDGLQHNVTVSSHKCLFMYLFTRVTSVDTEVEAAVSKIIPIVRIILAICNC